MHALIQFFLRFGHVLLFVLMEAIGFVLLVQGNDFQHSVVFSSAARVNGQLYEWREQTISYFNLREKNQLLWQQNSDLQQQIACLEASLQAYQIQEQALKPALDFDFIHARVIKNSVSMLSNYFTLDVGSLDGVEKGMGVVAPEGVVGIVKACSPHYSVVLSVLNVQSHISCKIKDSDVVASLSWPGGDTHMALLQELPGHLMWQDGDTIVTSGFSSAFPQGIAVGRLVESYKAPGDIFYTAKVALFPRFESLDNVRLMRRKLQDEQHILEEEAMP